MADSPDRLGQKQDEFLASSSPEVGPGGHYPPGPPPRDAGYAADEEEPQDLHAGTDEALGIRARRGTFASQRSVASEAANEHHAVESHGASRVLSRVLTGEARTYRTDLPLMGADKPYPPDPGEREPYRVEFNGDDDPLMPLNWPTFKKLRVCGVLAYATATVTWGSAVFAPSIPYVMKEFHVGQVVATLAVSLFVVGFATGPIVWGPLSELYGRKVPLILSMFLITCFTFGAATAKNFQTLVLCRFFAGATGSAPLSVVAAAFADMFRTKARGTAISIFSLCVVGGPMMAPIVGGYIVHSYLHWRWSLYITGIMHALALGLIIIFQDESYHPQLLVYKARELRKRTDNWAIYAQHETVELNLKEIMTTSVARPFILLVQEPILLLLSLYNGYVYGLLYMCLSAIPIIFTQYGFKGGNVELPYIALFLGCVAANLVSIFFFEPKFFRDLQKSGKPVLPEARVPPMMVGSVIFTIGIFWLCWTGAYYKHVHWLAPTFGAAFFGYGFVSLFNPIMNYIIDSYLMLAASALAANTFVRSAMGAAFPLFTTAMFHNLGVQWAGTLAGCLSAIMIPVPFLFYSSYGAKLRSKSKYATNVDDIKRKHDDEDDEKSRLKQD